jgi:transposase
MEISSDDLDIKEVALMLDKGYSTINRWIHEGVLNRQTGIRIYLKHARDGGRISVKRLWVEEFRLALQPFQ